jgi:hypothetical protein
MGISLVPLIRRNKEEPYLKRDVVGRASFKRRYFLYRNWEWKFIYLVIYKAQVTSLGIGVDGNPPGGWVTV